jgi:hypothetical protein
VGDSLPILKGHFLRGDWKKQVACSSEREDDAYLIVLDRDGIVQRLHDGGFDQARADDLRVLLTSLADGRTTVADHDLAHRRSAP